MALFETGGWTGRAAVTGSWSGERSAGVGVGRAGVLGGGCILAFGEGAAGLAGIAFGA